MEANDNRYASRKFILCWAALVVAWLAFVILAVIRQFWPEFYSITPQQILDFTKWGLGLYLTGNVIDQAVTKEPR